MKIEPLEVFERIDALCDEIGTPHFASSFKKAAIRQLPQAREIAQKWDDEKCNHDFHQSATALSIDDDFNITFYVDRHFKSHQDLFNWASKNDIKLPKNADKYASLDSLDNPVTRLTYTVEVGDIRFSLSYEREGLPGIKCYIKNVVKKELVCDL